MSGDKYYLAESVINTQRDCNHGCYNPITEFYTYTAFMQEAEKYIAKSNSSQNIAVYYLDITNFKTVNEFYGLQEGNALLKTLSFYMQSTRKGICGHFFSDNFVKIFTLEKGETIENVQKNLIDEFNTILQQQNKKYSKCNLGLVCGLYQIQKQESGIIQIVDKANSARKRGKLKNHVTCQIFNEELENKLRAEQLLEIEIENALRRKEFDFYLQPKVNITSGKVIGAEALARWIKSDGTIVEPSVFLPIMEEKGSIIQLDFIIYEKVLKYLQQIMKENKILVPISVNVSRAHLEYPDFSKRVHKLVQSYHILPALLEFELTESVFIYDLKKAKALLLDLKKYGYKVSVDDFGSGFSSLNILKELNFDVLKIDRKFISDTSYNSPKNTIIMSSIIEMANKLHMNVVLEGVETEKQIEFMKQLGCNVAQGYYFDKPLTHHQFMEHMLDRDYYYSLLQQNRVIPFYGKEQQYKNIDEMNQSEIESIMDTLFNTMAAGIVGFNMEDGSVLFANDRVFEISGYNRDELIDNNLMVFNTVLKLNNIMKIKNLDIKQALFAKGKFYNEYPITKKDGKIAYIRVNGGYASSVEWGNFLLCTIYDVTEEYEVRKEMEKSQRTMDEILNSINGGVARLVINDRFRVDFASDGFYKLSGYTRLKSLLNPFYNRFRNIIHPIDVQKIRELTPDIINGKIKQISHRIYKRDGSVAWVTGYINRIYYEKQDAIMEVFYIDTTNRRTIEEKQQKFYANVYESVVCGIMQYKKTNLGFDCIHANSEAINIFGYTDHLKEFWKVRTPDMLGFIHPDDKQEYLNKLLSLHNEGDVVSFEHRILRMDNRQSWIQGAAKLIRNQDDDLIIQSTFFDTTYYRQLQRRFEQNYRQLAKIMKQTIFDYDVKTDTITFTKYDDQNFMFPDKIENYLEKSKANTMNNLVQPLDTSEFKDVKNENDVYSNIKKKYVLADGSIRWLRSSFFVSRNEQGEIKNYIGTLVDITDQETKNKELEHMAQRDPLTGLYNKGAFKRKCIKYLATKGRYQNKALLFIDLDNFKVANDTFGHQFGDRLLVKVGKVLETSFRKEDIVGRVGGDEFAILMKDINDSDIIFKKAALLSEKIREQMMGLGFPEGSCSIGIAVDNDLQNEYDVLLAKADRAMYLAKKNGKNQYYVLDSLTK